MGNGCASELNTHWSKGKIEQSFEKSKNKYLLRRNFPFYLSFVCWWSSFTALLGYICLAFVLLISINEISQNATLPNTWISVAMLFCDINKHNSNVQTSIQISLIEPVIIQYGNNCIFGIMEVCSFQPKYIIQKPASHFLFNSLAVLVRHSQAQKCIP